MPKPPFWGSTLAPTPPPPSPYHRSGVFRHPGTPTRWPPTRPSMPPTPTAATRSARKQNYRRWFKGYSGHPPSETGISSLRATQGRRALYFSWVVASNPRNHRLQPYYPAERHTASGETWRRKWGERWWGLYIYACQGGEIDVIFRS